MDASTAVVKYEAGKKDIAKYRAEKRLANLTTIFSRLEHSRLHHVYLGISLGYAIFSGLIFLDVMYASFFDTFTYMFISDLGTGMMWAASSLVAIFFTLLSNKISLREKFKREELKRLDAEEAGLVLAKKKLLQHPNSVELQVAYDSLVESVRRSRQEDGGEE